MLLGVGLQQIQAPGIVFPGVTYSLRIQPLIVVPVVTDGSSKFQTFTKMLRIAKDTRLVTQALELKNGLGMAFTNALLITVPYP